MLFVGARWQSQGTYVESVLATMSSTPKGIIATAKATRKRADRSWRCNWLRHSVGLQGFGLAHEIEVSPRQVPVGDYCFRLSRRGLCISTLLISRVGPSNMIFVRIWKRGKHRRALYFGADDRIANRKNPTARKTSADSLRHAPAPFAFCSCLAALV
jgi:hypothetical protein